MHAAILEQLGHDSVSDGGADLTLDVVTHNRHAGVGELLGPHRIRSDEHRQRVDEGHAGVDRALGVELVGFLRTYGQVGHHHVDLVVLENLHHVDRLVIGELNGVGVVLADAVQCRPAAHDDVGRRHVGDLDGVVLRGEDSLGEVEAHFLGIDVERGDELDVANVVRAEHDMHQAGNRCVGVGVLVVLHALHQRGRAVADPDDGDAHIRRRSRRVVLSHGRSPSCTSVYRGLLQLCSEWA